MCYISRWIASLRGTGDATRTNGSSTACTKRVFEEIQLTNGALPHPGAAETPRQPRRKPHAPGGEQAGVPARNLSGTRKRVRGRPERPPQAEGLPRIAASRKRCLAFL